MTHNDLENLFDRLFPLNRSITGKGYRRSLDILREYIPLTYIDFKSGTKVFDWEVPEEWIIHDAYILDPDGRKILDYTTNNLSVVNYSEPVDLEMDLEELKPNLHTIPELPEAIPYITSYYKRTWGFCMAHNQYKLLKSGKYKLVIDSHFRKGIIRIGETLLPGKSKKEILLTSYLCHPSMANNELGGPLVLAYLYSMLKAKKDRRFSYRFIINPETIGSIAYLSENHLLLKKKLLGGVVLNCLGGPEGKLNYKFSKYSDSILDNYFLKKSNQKEILTREFSPLGGSDERQYNSPDISLPVGQLARTVYEEHAEYHNSLDNKEFMDLDKIEKSGRQILAFLEEIEDLRIYIVNQGFGEPFLSKYNLYPTLNSNQTRKDHSGDSLKDGKRRQRAIMNLLCFSDGKNSTEDIATRLKEEPSYIDAVAELLVRKNLLKEL